MGTEGSYRDSLATSNRDSLATSNRDSLATSNRDSIASSKRDSIDSSNRDSIVSSRRDTLESVHSSGRKSTASSRRDSALSESGVNESGFDADRSNDNDMNNTAFTIAGTARSSSAGTSRRSSVETDPDEPAATTPATARSARSDRSLNLSAPSEGGHKSGKQSLQGSADPNRSARRVSFPDSLGGLSPIQGTNSQPPSGSSRRTSKSRDSFGTSLADSGERSSAGRSSQGRSSVEGSEHYTPEDNNDFGDYGGDDPNEDVSRIMSQTDTPVADKSNRSGFSSARSSAMKTPYSEADSSRLSMSGSRRLSLPTPGSNDFVRGTQLADETYIEESGSGEEEATDDEADTSAVITPAAGEHSFLRVKLFGLNETSLE
jgi:hypothetical protein